MGLSARRRWTLISLTAFAVAAAVAVHLVKSLLQKEDLPANCTCRMTLIGLMTLLTFGFGLVSIDIALLDPANTFSTKITLLMYIKYRLVKYYGKIINTRHTEQGKYLDTQQQQFLLNLINYNKDTLYGVNNHFSEIQSAADFRRTVPLSNYKAFQPYVDEICIGGQNILTKCQPYGLGRTSGTTGKPKLIPMNHYNLSLGMRKYYFLYMYDPIVKGVPMKLKRTLTLGNEPQVERTPSGLLCAPVSYFYKFRDFTATTPAYVFDIPDEASTFYIHAVFGCKETEVSSLIFKFALEAVLFFEFIEDHWEAICDDIETGYFTTKHLCIDEDVVLKMQRDLPADPQRAKELRRFFSEGSVGLASRIWPDLEYCRVTYSGTMSSYSKILKRKYLKDVLLLPHGYGSTEGFYGHNMTEIKTQPNFFLTYPFGFFEFVREEEVDEDQPETLLAHEVSVGESYELVITNGLGLYRYRVGDVVKITGHLNNCPLMEVCYRSAQTLNIAGEKTTEVMMYTAVDLCCDRLGVQLTDYTACEDIHLTNHTGPVHKPHYLLFVELHRVLSTKEINKFDEALMEVSEAYKTSRTRHSLDPIHVIQLRRNSFKDLRSYTLQETRNPQYKVPRALRVRKFLDFLLENTLDNEQGRRQCSWNI